MSLRLGLTPKPQYCVLLYKAPTEQWPQEVRGPFKSYALALDYGTALSPADFPSVRFSVLPYVKP